ncbi:UNVERIFIED_CONTAM: putative 2-oxoglutarate-dependent dioxygenase SLC1 [Sesamum calycinum]|uniref:2-oxoglutarate-dependent dioxygenase SLC1 n=1 Tax=Sesamum calycinum TaxID=2727403 RepID=A0AAW2LT62_9LAMI
MGEYVVAVQELAVKIVGVITESLGLGPSYLSSKLDDGMQVMAVNCYPQCPQPELALGLPPHSDYSCLTVVLQDMPGLQILDSRDKSWKAVPMIPGALQVNVGDQLEVLSNGSTKVLSTREMVEEDHPNGYRESSFRDFLNYIAKNDLAEGRNFLNTLKIR